MNGTCVAYYRVSTARQGESGLGLEAQRRAVADYVARGNWQIVAEFTEVESGTKSARPELARAFQACRARRATLIISKLDRLSRDAHFLLGLQKAGVKFVAVDMPEANEMVVGIMAVIAEGEHKMISTRTKAALAVVKARGKRLGGFKGYHLTRADSEAGTRALQAAAEAHATDMAPIIAELAKNGCTTLQSLARALTAQQVPTSRGSATWTATAVRRVIKRLEATETCLTP